MIQNEISFVIKIHIKIDLIFSKKVPGLQKRFFVEKNGFFSVDYLKIIELHVVHT